MVRQARTRLHKGLHGYLPFLATTNHCSWSETIPFTAQPFPLERQQHAYLTHLGGQLWHVNLLQGYAEIKVEFGVL